MDRNAKLFNATVIMRRDWTLDLILSKSGVTQTYNVTKYYVTRTPALGMVDITVQLPPDSHFYMHDFANDTLIVQVGEHSSEGSTSAVLL